MNGQSPPTIISDVFSPVKKKPSRSLWRRIRTEIPVPESLPILKRLRAVEPVSMSAMPPVIWDQAEGFLIRDPFGNQWIDLTSGIVLANAGHSHPRIMEAVRRMLKKPLLATYIFPGMERLNLLETLATRAPIPRAKAILFSAGTEATECAIMLMRRRGRQIAPDKKGIVSFAGGFHGRTWGVSLASGHASQTDCIDRHSAGFFQIPFPFCPQCPWGRREYNYCGGECFTKCLAKLQEQGANPSVLAGFIGESMPGWATWPIPCDFAAALREWTKQNDIVLTFDEIQSGCGRTGRFFAFEHTGITPDLITLGKGLTSSVPASAVIGPEEILDIPRPGEMSSTHGGNPLCAAATKANLEVLKSENLIERSEKLGRQALAKIENWKEKFPGRISSIQGRGLFISIHLQKGPNGAPDVEGADTLAKEAVRRGVMMFVTGKGFLKITPPLVIAPHALEEALDVLSECLTNLKNG